MNYVIIGLLALGLSCVPATTKAQGEEVYRLTVVWEQSVPRVGTFFAVKDTITTECYLVKSPQTASATMVATSPQVCK